MTKIDIVSGFLGAGKTTLIKKMVKEAYQGEKLVLIENEFGEISIDGGFLKDSGVQISEMSSGCICCSLVGDFNKALKDVHEQFHPDRILIEPSGVGKLSDVIVAVENTVKDVPDMKLNSFVTVADATKVKIYMKNFGEFYNNQIESAGTIILSRTQRLSQEKLEAAVALLREKNPNAAILTTPWDQLDGMTILSAIEKVSLADELLAHMRAEHEADEAEHEHEHHHHHHDEDEHNHDHCCHHHDHDDDDDDDHDHEHCCHHHHDEDEHDHDHHHHHHDGEECDDPHCGCHHHHHHADEVFTSWGTETVKAYSEAELEHILTALDSGEYGALVLAQAGLHRLGLDSRISRIFTPEEMIPSACQGILAVQAREGFDISCLQSFHDADALDCARAERAFIRALDGGCSSPVAAFARMDAADTLRLTGLYVSEDRTRTRVETITCPRADGAPMAAELALRMKREG